MQYILSINLSEKCIPLFESMDYSTRKDQSLPRKGPHDGVNIHQFIA